LHGWFTPGNSQSLGQFLSDDTRLILELGSWLGKSARWMLDKAPHATLVAVDEFARHKGLRVKVAAPDGWWLE